MGENGAKNVKMDPQAKQVTVTLTPDGVMQIGGTLNMVPLEVAGLLLKAANLVGSQPPQGKMEKSNIARPGLHIPPGFNPKGVG